MEHFIHDGLDFEYESDGSDDGEPIVLLHGFPQHAATWRGTTPALAAAGYRTLALNQRGYSPGARPASVSAYRLNELASDVICFISEVGRGKVHLVGHDLGAEVAWITACTAPDLIQSLTVVSTPHPRALTRAFLTTDQAIHSWYMPLLQLPLLPEVVFRTMHGKIALRLLERTGLEASFARQYVNRLLNSPSALRGAINWYRAFPLDPGQVFAAPPVNVNTQYIWSSADSVVTRKAAEMTAKYVAGPYHFKVLEGISHWVPEEASGQLSELILRQARAYPISDTSAGSK